MTSVTDNFTRANNASLGSNWTAFSWSGSLGMQIVSNTATGNTNGTYGDYWSANTFGNNQTSTITVANPPTSGQWVGVTVRTSGAGAGYLMIWYNGACYLYNENGSSNPLVLATWASVTLVANDTLELQVIGNVLTGFHNGTSVGTYTDANNLFTSGAPGIAMYENSGSLASFTGADITITNVTVADYAGQVERVTSGMSLFNQTTSGIPGATSDNGAYTMGVQYSVSAAAVLDGIWFYSPPGSQELPEVIGSALVASQSIAYSQSASWSGAAGSGWVYAAFTSPLPLTPGVQYKALINKTGTGNNWYVSTPHYWDTGAGQNGVTNGILSAPNAAGSDAGSQNSFNSSATLTYPLGAFQSSNYYIDVQITPAPSTNISVSDYAGATFSPNINEGTTVVVGNTNLGYVVQNVQVARWLIASGGTGPYTWAVTSGALPAGMTLSAAGKLGGTPTATGTSSFTVTATDTQGDTGSAPLSIQSISAPFSAGSPTTDGNGVITYTVTSAINTDGSGLTVRVLNPTSPGVYPHGFIFTLPVNGGTDDMTYGNGLDTIRTLGLHNTYNLSVIEISSGGNWFGDNPTNSALQQETYMLQVVAWAHATYGTGGELNWLIGFSRSGIGGQGLFFHRPDLYAGVASWDFPAMMNTYAGGDPNGTVGGSSATTYGTADNFTANYQLSPSNLAKWSAGQNFGILKRVWIGGYISFQADVTQYDPVLSNAGVLHMTNFVSESAHNWAPTPGWVGVAIPALLGANTYAITLADNAAAVEYLLNPNAAQTTINRTGIVLVAAHYQPVF